MYNPVLGETMGASMVVAPIINKPILMIHLRPNMSTMKPVKKTKHMEGILVIAPISL